MTIPVRHHSAKSLAPTPVSLRRTIIQKLPVRLAHIPDAEAPQYSATLNDTLIVPEGYYSESESGMTRGVGEALKSLKVVELRDNLFGQLGALESVRIFLCFSRILSTCQK